MNNIFKAKSKIEKREACRENKYVRPLVSEELQNALLKLLYLRITELYKKMERQQGLKLGYGQKSARNQRQN